MTRPGFRYDEMRQVGVDFEDVDQVAAYDAKQGSDAAAERLLLARLGVKPGDAVIDLGCGTGAFAREAARSGARVRGVDVSRVMLDFLAQRAAAEGLGIEIEHAGFLTFEVAPASIDLIVTRFALHHLPDFWKQVALLRMREALRETGTLYLRDVVFSFEPDGWASSIESWVARMPELSGFSREEFETHVRDEYSTYSWVLAGLIERAGFEIVDRALPNSEYAEYVCRPSGRADAPGRVA